MFHATLRSLLARKLRLILSGISIVLGVATVCASFVLTDTIGKVFDNIFEEGLAKTAVVVRGTESDISSQHIPVPSSVVDKVKQVPGVESAVGLVAGEAHIVDRKGKSFPYHDGPPGIGFSFNADPNTSTDIIRAGRAPTADDEIVIDQFTAEETHYTVGDSAPVITRQPRKIYRIVGIFTSGETASQAGASLIAFEPRAAQKIFGRPGEVQQILVASEPGVSARDLVRRVTAVLPKGAEAVTGQKEAQDQANDTTEFLRFFLVVLLVFAGVGLFVGAFNIFNTFSMLVGQRVRELALLRAIGASRRQVVNAVLLEAVVVGFIASTIGLGVGVLLALGLRSLMEWRTGGGGIASGPLVFGLKTVIWSYAVGVVVTTIAALVPARRATRIPPVAALRDAELPDPSLRRSTIIGSMMLALGVGLLVLGLQGKFLALGLGAVLGFLGVTTLSPLLAGPIVRLLTAPFQGKVPGRLGRRNAERNPRRTSITAAALMIGLALVSMVSVLGASLKTSVSGVIDRAFAADYAVQPKTFEGGVPPAVATTLERRSEFAQVDRLGFAPAKVDNHKTFVTALPSRAIGVTVDLKRESGQLTLGPGEFLTDKSTAEKYNWAPGQSLAVQFERGASHKLLLKGTYADNGLAGPYLMDQTERQYFQERVDGVVLVKTSSGVSSQEARKVLDDVLKDYPTDQAVTKKQFIGDLSKFVDGIVVFLTIMLLMSIIIAIVGIVNTLALSVSERTRELGLLRAVGLSRRQTRRMIRVEGIVVALFGAVLGLLVGTSLGVAIVRALSDQGIDTLTFPWLRMIVFVLFGALIGVIAAWLPARRASRLNVLDAIATE